MTRLKFNKTSEVDKLTKRKQTLVQLIVGAVLALFLTHALLRGHLVSGGDVFYPPEPLNALNDNLNIWISNQNLGSGNISVASTVFLGILSLLRIIFSPLTTQYLWFFALFFLIFWNFVISAKTLIKIFGLNINNWIVVLAAALYLVNPIMFVSITQSSYLAAYSFMPLLIFFSAKIFVENEQKYVFYMVISSIFYQYVSVNPPIFAASFILPIMIPLICLIAKKDSFKSILKKTIFAGIFYGLVNLFWILPLAISGNNIKAETSSNWVIWTSAKASYYSLIHFLGNWSFGGSAYGSQYQIFSKWYQNTGYSILISIFWISLILSLGKILYDYKKSPKTTIATVILLSILQIYLFLSSATAGPFKILFLAIYKFVPYFWLFREPWVKFTPGYMYVLALLTIITVSTLSKKNLVKRIFLYSFSAIVLFNIFVAAFVGIVPSERGNLPGYYSKVPEYYNQLLKYSQDNSSSFRALLYPQNPFYQVHLFWPGDGYYGSDPLAYFYSGDLVSSEPGGGYSANDSSVQMTNSLYTAISNKNWTLVKNLIKIFAVDRVLIRNDLDYTHLGSGDTSSSSQKHNLEKSLQLIHTTSLGKINDDKLTQDQYYSEFSRSQESLDGGPALELFKIANPLARFYSPQRINVAQGKIDAMDSVLSDGDFTREGTIYLSDDTNTLPEGVNISTIIMAPEQESEDYSEEYSYYEKNYDQQSSHIVAKTDKTDFIEYLDSVKVKKSWIIKLLDSGSYRIKYYIPDAEEMQARLLKISQTKYYLDDRQLVINPKIVGNHIELLNLDLRKGEEYRLVELGQKASPESWKGIEPSKDAKISINNNKLMVTIPPLQNGCVSYPLEQIDASKKYAINLTGKVYSDTPFSMGILQDTDRNRSEKMQESGESFDPATQNDFLVTNYTIAEGIGTNNKIKFQGIFKPEPLSHTYALRLCFDWNIELNKKGRNDDLALSSKMEINNFTISPVDDSMLIIENHKDNIIASQSSPQVEFQKLSNSSYLVRVKNASGNFPLIFSESYNSNWRIIKDEHHYPSGNLFQRLLISINSKSIARNHFVANGYANGWLLDAQGDSEYIVENTNWAKQFIAQLVSGFVFLLSVIILVLGKKRWTSKESR